MTLKTASRIETAFVAVTVILALPFAITLQILEWMEKPFVWVLDIRAWLSFKVGNRLLRMLDLVKSGDIANTDVLRKWTARELRNFQKPHNLPTHYPHVSAPPKP